MVNVIINGIAVRVPSGVNDMIVAEEVVNICSGNFTRGNGADNGRRAGYGVAACKRLGAAFYDAVRQGREALAVDRDAGQGN